MRLAKSRAEDIIDQNERLKNQLASVNKNKTDFDLICKRVNKMHAKLQKFVGQILKVDSLDTKYPYLFKVTQELKLSEDMVKTLDSCYTCYELIKS